MPAKTFEVEYLRNKGLPYEGYVKSEIEDRIGDIFIYRLIFEDGGKYWEIRCATENVWSSWDGFKEVAAREVEPRIVTKTEWVIVE